MNDFLKSAGRTALIFAGLFALQWIIPYVFLTLAGIGYGIFQVASGDRKTGWPWIIAGLVLGVNAWIFDRYFR